MFHNRYTISISIGQLAILMDSHDLKLVRRVKIYIPKYFLKRAFKRLILEVNETLNKSALEKEIESGVVKIKLFNKAFNLYPALVELTGITWDQKHLDLIEEITGYKLQSIEDREILISETLRLQDKYREISVNHTPEGISFYQVIVAVEDILGRAIDRNIKLFEFQVMTIHQDS